MEEPFYYRCSFCFSVFEEPRIKEREVFAINTYRKFEEQICPNCGGYHIIKKQGDIVIDKLTEGCR